MFSNLGCPILLTILVCPILKSDFEAEPRPGLLDFKGRAWDGRVDWKERPGRDETAKRRNGRCRGIGKRGERGRGTRNESVASISSGGPEKTSSELTFKH